MADTYTLPVLTDADINGIVTAGQDGTYNITYTNLTANQIAEIGAAFEQAMKNNLKPVAINNGDYDDLTKKPIIPNGYTEESAFNKIAFSGKASDLNNDSGFLTVATNAYTGSPASNITQNRMNEWDAKVNNNDLAIVATTGNYEDLIKTFFSINFGNFIYTKTENNIYELVSNENQYILRNFGFLIDSYSNINNLYNEEREDLLSEINNLLINFNNGKLCYLQVSNNYYLITTINSNYDNETHELTNLTLSCSLQNMNNYENFLNHSHETKEEQRDIIFSITEELYNIAIIIDIKNNIMYSSYKKIFPIESNNEGIFVYSPNGSINLKISNKENNKLSIITDEGEQGLYVN